MLIHTKVVSDARPAYGLFCLMLDGDQSFLQLIDDDVDGNDDLGVRIFRASRFESEIRVPESNLEIRIRI